MNKWVRNISIAALLFAALFLYPDNLHTQPQAKPKKTRILFLLDASSSMTYNWNSGYTRFDVASNILLRIMDSVYALNNEIEFAVRAYGTGYPAQQHNCIDTRLEVPFNLQNTEQIKTRLHNIIPLGSSPIAYSLRKASENELSEVDKYDYSVIFITDGGESCNGDVCGIYQELLQKKISIKPYIIGLDSNQVLKSYYACLGNYIEVTTADDIAKAINLILDANRSIIDKPKQLKLVTQFSNVPVVKDTLPPAPPKPKVVQVANLNGYVVPVSLHQSAMFKKPSAWKFPKKTAILHFEYEEEKKSSRGLSELAGVKYQVVLPKSKNIVPRKMVMKKQKADLHFEYEEAKKTCPSLVTLYPALRSSARNQVKTIKPKSAFRFPKSASLQFEYEEPKKVSPPMLALFPMPSPNPLKRAKASLRSKPSGFRFAKKASLQFEYEEPKKVSPPMLAISFIQAPVVITKINPKLGFKKSSYRFAKSAKLVLPYEMPRKDTFTALRMVKDLRRISYAYRMPDIHRFNLKDRRATLHFTVEEKKPTTAKRDTVLVAPIDPSSIPNPSVEFSTEVVADVDTKVQVYFKGTNGKTYPTAKPMIEMQDAKTNRTVTSFRRDMNGQEPVPQKVAAGTYNLVIKGFDDLYANNIEIQPKTTTKVYIKVSDGTLKFTYQGNIKRPVSEFKAIVNRRFASGATVNQKCDEAKMYEPGTYYVEINTLPVTKASIDLTFDVSYEIQIREPGMLAIMNANPVGKVQIQYMLGDQYVTFYTMNVTGDLKQQRVQLLPNTYKLIYPANPSMPQLGNKELVFKINSNQQQELEIK